MSGAAGASGASDAISNEEGRRPCDAKMQRLDWYGDIVVVARALQRWAAKRAERDAASFGEEGCGFMQAGTAQPCRGMFPAGSTESRREHRTCTESAIVFMCRLAGTVKPLIADGRT